MTDQASTKGAEKRSGGGPQAIASSHCVYCIALALEAAIFHWRVLFVPGYLFPWDFRTVHLPLATFLADSLRAGQFPLWDPYTYCGNPIFANIQAATFYPPAFLCSLAAAMFGAGVLVKLLVASVVAQTVLAGITTFFLMRRLGAKPGAAWISGTVFELGCFFAAQAEHIGAMQAACWLPLIWLSVFELRGRLRPRWLAALAVSLGMMVLAGLPQVAVAGFASALVLALLMRRTQSASWKTAGFVALGACWAILIAAVQFVPTYQLEQNSVAKYRAEWLLTGGGMPPGALWSLIIPNYWSVFEPSKFHGPIDLTFLYLYSSILGLALAAAVLIWKPNITARMFGALTLLAALAMMGDKTVLGRGVLAALPVDIRIGIHPEYFFCVFSLGLAVLAGLGADRFLVSKLQFAAGILIAADLIAVSSGRPMNVNSILQEPGVSHDALDGNRDVVTRLRELTNTANPPWRFDMMADVSFVLSSSAPLLAIPTANGCDPMAPERIIQVRTAFSPGPRWGTCYQVKDAGSPALALSNVRYLLARSELSATALKPVFDSGGYRIYENTRALPRFFLTRCVKPAANLEKASELLRAADFDPSRCAILEPPAARLRPSSASEPGEVSVISYKQARITVRVRTAADSMLVATDSWYPGWSATVDGRPAPLYAADAAFRGIAVPAGNHTVEMRFKPAVIFYSAALSIAALLAALHFLYHGRLRPSWLAASRFRTGQAKQAE